MILKAEIIWPGFAVASRMHPSMRFPFLVLTMHPNINMRQADSAYM